MFLVRHSTTFWTIPSTSEVAVPPLLSVEEAATELGTPVRFVRRLVHERRIRFHKIGKYVRIAQDDLQAFIAAGAVPSAPTTSGGAVRYEPELSVPAVTPDVNQRKEPKMT